MNINVLGASGGLAGLSGSTCLQISETILIDAGTGISQLNLAQMQQVRHIFLSHSHSDHICCLPMLLANLFNALDPSQSVTLYGSKDTFAALKAHVFNWVIWPDMTVMPSAEKPLVRLQEIAAGESITIEGIEIKAFSTYHTVPTFGYAVRKAGQLTAFVADTGYAESVVSALNALAPLDAIILECSFPNELEAIALQSCHLTPQLCEKLLGGLTEQPKRICINHLKPDLAERIQPQLAADWQLLL